MADPQKDRDLNDLDINPEAPSIETSEQEQESIRNANDRDQELEREGLESERNRGYDDAVRGQGRDVNPDSAEADIDRDDTISD